MKFLKKEYIENYLSPEEKEQYKKLSERVVILRRRKYQRRTDRKRRLRTIERLGGKCVKCEFDDARALQIDHIRGGGNKEFSKLKGGTRGFYIKLEKMSDDELYAEYQILCANCNWIKRVEKREGYSSATDEELESELKRLQAERDHFVEQFRERMQYTPGVGYVKSDKFKEKIKNWTQLLKPLLEQNMKHKEIADQLGWTRKQVNRRCEFCNLKRKPKR